MAKIYSLIFLKILYLTYGYIIAGDNVLQGKENVKIWSEAFSCGRIFRYRYNLQASNGYSHLISSQKACSRLEADVAITFLENNKATLQMERVDAGQWNGNADINFNQESMSQILPIRVFKSTLQSETKYLQFIEHLNLPLEFSYVDGRVENIRFSKQDKPWSKNVKKAVLNLIQLNNLSKFLESFKKEEINKSFVQNEVKKLIEK